MTSGIAQHIPLNDFLELGHNLMNEEQEPKRIFIFARYFIQI
jgi:hypothetical protein